MIRLLNITGVPDTNRIAVTENRYGDMNRLTISMMGTNSLEALFDPTRMQHTTITLGGVEPLLPAVAHQDVVLNTICDPDTNATALHQAEAFVQSLECPIVNQPSRLFRTTRDATYDLLHDLDGIIAPQTIRIAPRSLSEIPEMVSAASMSYPYIFRSAGEHGGKGMVLVTSEADLEKLERYAFDGRDFYVIAFNDFHSDDRLYRKSRLIVIDGVVYPRHQIITDSWNVHAESRKNVMEKEQRYREEEQRFLESPPEFLQDYGQKIYEKLGLEFFGIDCSITAANELILFEVNACMRIVTGGEGGYHMPAIERIKTALNTMLEEKARG